MGAVATESVPSERVTLKLQAISNIADIIVNAGGSNQDKVNALKSLMGSVYNDKDFDKYPYEKEGAVCIIQSAIDYVTGKHESPFDEAEPTPKIDPSEFMEGSNFSFISKSNTYNPTNQVVTPKAMIKWQAMQILNMYFWFNMPCVVMVDYDHGMIIRTHDITYDYIVDVVNDVHADVVMFTDGNRSTVLKDR